MSVAVRIERDGPVATIVLDRPDVRNALDRETAAALAAAVRAVDADDRVQAGVLWGRGGTFCAGADLHAIAMGRGNRVVATGDGPMGPSRLRSEKPFVAAIAGHAVAGGLELALWCDLRVAEESAVLGVFCRRFGVPLVDGGTVRLPRIVGQGHALDLILTGRPVGAREALSMGLVNRVVPTGEARNAAEALARSLADYPQVCLRADRSAARDTWNLSEVAALQQELAGAQAALRQESRSGAARFSAGAGRHGGFSGEDRGAAGRPGPEKDLPAVEGAKGSGSGKMEVASRAADSAALERNLAGGIPLGPRIGVIGGAQVRPEVYARAQAVGREIAERGGTVVCGGRGGVMEAACRGAAEVGGLTLGILPGDDPDDANSWVGLPVVTGLGEARNVIVARTAEVLIAIGGELGTLSEIAFALKFGRPVISLGAWQDDPRILAVGDAGEAVAEAWRLLGASKKPML